jgi:hypothetical protein
MNLADWVANCTPDDMQGVSQRISKAMLKKSKGKSWFTGDYMSPTQVADFLYQGPHTCFFTKVDLSPSPTFGKQFNNAQYDRNIMSWDRLDPTKGYVPGNVVLCTLWFNKMKSSMSTDQMITTLQTLIEMRGGK